MASFLHFFCFVLLLQAEVFAQHYYTNTRVVPKRRLAGPTIEPEDSGDPDDELSSNKMRGTRSADTDDSDISAIEAEDSGDPDDELSSNKMRGTRGADTDDSDISDEAEDVYTKKTKGTSRTAPDMEIPGLDLPGTFSLRAIILEGSERKYMNFYQDDRIGASRVEMLDENHKPIRAYIKTAEDDVIMLNPGSCKIMDSADPNLLKNYDYPGFEEGPQEKIVIREKSVLVNVHSQPPGTKKRETFYSIKDSEGKLIPVRGCIEGSVCMDIQKFCRHTPKNAFFIVDKTKCTN